MREISSGLREAGKSWTSDPYVLAILAMLGEEMGAFYIDTEDTFTPGTIVYLEHSEDPYSAECTIGIKPNLDWWEGMNLCGYQLGIGYGYHTPAHEWSIAPPLYVVAQHEISYEGQSLIELVCVDLWQKMDYHILGPDPETGDVRYMPIWDKTLTVQEIIVQLLSEMDPAITFVLDSEDPDHLVSSYKPSYGVEIGTPLRKVLRDLIAMTKNSLEVEVDLTGGVYSFVMHSKYMDPDEASEYSYNTEGLLHTHFSNVRQYGLTIPNDILFVDHLPTSDIDSPQYVGEAKDLESIARFGKVYAVYAPPQGGTISGQAECQQIAECLLARIQAETDQGRMIAPHNCGQELYDVIDITDVRTGRAFTGRVGGLTHRYASEEFKDKYQYVESSRQRSYTLDLRIGGLTKGLNVSSPDKLVGELSSLTMVKNWPIAGPVVKWILSGFGEET